MSRRGIVAAAALDALARPTRASWAPPPSCSPSAAPRGRVRLRPSARVAPGARGRLRAGGGADGVADAAAFCVDSELWKCRREEFANRISEDEAAACYRGIDLRCEGFAWPAGCAPTPASADACTTLLQRADLLELTNDELLAMYDDCDLCR